MKIFILIIAFAFVSGCDVSLKKYESPDDGSVEDSDIDHTGDNETGDDENFDDDTEFPDDKEFTDEELIEIVSLTRVKNSAPFPEMVDFNIYQSAVLDLYDNSVKRNFNHIDTSFDMVDESVVKIREIMTKTLENNECMDCSENENFIEMVFEDDEICHICDESLPEDIDNYLLIPVRTMLWPFEPLSEPHPVGHLSASFQNYNEEEGNYEGAYFHHGIDIIMPEVKEVYNQISGKITRVDHYMTELVGEHPLYFEVVVETVNGLIFEYHHIDKNTVPKKIYEALESGEIIPKGEFLGKIVPWPVPDAFSEKLFHHVHLNIMNQDKIKINPALLMIPQVDLTEPVIEEIFLIDENRTKTLSDEPVEPFHIVIKAHDFTDVDPWPNPVRFSEVFIYDEAENIVFHHPGYDFIATMESNEQEFVCDYYLCLLGGQSYSFGNYQKREFFVVVTTFDIEGNMTEPVDPSLFDPGEYILSVRSCDENGNCTEESMEISF